MKTAFIKLIDHCDQCDTCIQGKERHFQLLGKCIGGNMEKVFAPYVLLSLL